MKIIIAGAGEVGTHLAKLLSIENQEIVLIDENQKKLELLSSNYDLLSVVGSPTSLHDLKECGVEKSDLFIAVTPFESVNMTACMLATNLGTKVTLARINNYEYLLPQNSSFFKEVGIDSLIYPEMLAAKEVMKSLKNSWQRMNLSFGGDALELVAINVRKGAEVLDKQFKTNFLDNDKLRVVAISRESETIIPQGSDQIKEGDLVFVLVKEGNLEFTREQFGKTNRTIKNVMIMGGSRIGVKAAQYISKTINVKIIEKDYEKCVKLSEKLNEGLIINGDGRDLELLKEEGIQEMDAFVALTDSDEINIMACLAAKRFGVLKTIAEIENLDYIPLVQNLDIGTIINKKLIAANHIYQLILDTKALDVKCLYSCDAKIVEFIAKEGSRVTKSNLQNLHLPENVNFGGYIREGKGYICSGSTVIKPDDKVIVFCFSDGLNEVAKFFK
jgi:trk system potassium uptake protein TrkA